MTEPTDVARLPLTERVHALLRDDILRARLLPGETILEQELAARFGVSKTPVREALRLLVQDGWVVVVPRRGYRVRPLGLDDLRDVFELREMIEPGFAAEAAARIGGADAELSASVATQRSATRDLAAGLAAAADFHVRVAELSGNARAKRIVANLVDEVTRLHFLMPSLEHHISSADEIAAHAEITDAITAGDERRAEKVMREHLRTTHRILVDVFAAPDRVARASCTKEKRMGLHPIETASRDEIAALQLERMQWTLSHAYEHVPHYRQAFDTAQVKPSDLRELADLDKFPFTTKDDLRANYPYGMFAVPQDQVRRIHASSGTTGQPTVVGYSAQDIEMWAQVVARSIYAAGGRPGMRVHVAYGYGLFTGGLGAHYGAEALGCTVIPVSGGQSERQVRLIQDFKPDVIMVTPSYMLALLDEFDRLGVDPRTSSLKIGIFGAEPWTEDMRVEVEQRAGIDAVDIYGLSEVIGPGVANECVETKDGLHVWEDHFYPEVIDPVTGAVLPDGEHGELVFTSLTKEAMPIIRYRTRDLTRLLPGTARSMRRIEKITGRSDDMLIVRGVNVFPSQIEEQLLRVPELAPHYEIVLTRPSALDEMSVRVESREPVADDVRDEVARRLAGLVKDNVGVTVSCDVGAPGTLPRSEGKAKRVHDQR